MKKISEVLDSRNFFVTLLSMVLIGLQFNSIDAGYSAEGIYDLFQGTTLTSAAVLVFVNFLNPVTKLIKKFIDKEFNWNFIKSQNFTTQILSLITIVLSVFLDEVSTGLVSALILNAWNLVSHLIQKAKDNDANEQLVSDINP